MRRFILFLLLLFVGLTSQAEVNITASEVYTQALLIEKETQLVKQFYNITQPHNPIVEMTAELKLRHIWQEGYMLTMKLIMFRRKMGLGAFYPVVIEPLENLDPRFTWAQANRILNEIRIMRKIIGIPGEIDTKIPVVPAGKRPVDVYNKLYEIEGEWDVLIGRGFDASYAFDQVWRLNEDVNALMSQLNVFDNAVPPAKNPNATPQDSLDQTFLVLEQVQRLQKSVGLQLTDFSQLHKSENVVPDDTFNMVCLILAEVQMIKARIGLTHNITPPAPYHEGKKPADVRQFLGYIANKLALIEHL